MEVKNNRIGLIQPVFQLSQPLISQPPDQIWKILFVRVKAVWIQIFLHTKMPVYFIFIIVSLEKFETEIHSHFCFCKKKFPLMWKNTNFLLEQSLIIFCTSIFFQIQVAFATCGKRIFFLIYKKKISMLILGFSHFLGSRQKIIFFL